MRPLSHKLKPFWEVEDLIERDAISGRFRTEGLVLVYVKDIQTFYYLAGGITNAHWVALGSGGATNVRHVDIDFSFQSDDGTVLIDTVLGGTVTGTLMLAADAPNKHIRCKVNGEGRFGLAFDSAEFLDGQISPVYFDVPMIAFTVVSDGSNWFIV